MLWQCYKFIKLEENFPKECVIRYIKLLLRGDFFFISFSQRIAFRIVNWILFLNVFFFRNFILVRADISRLPFPSRSVDAVHAGAAIHCWPSPSTAVAEISRVLRPGGVFVATTFILNGPYSGLPL